MKSLLERVRALFVRGSAKSTHPHPDAHRRVKTPDMQQYRIAEQDRLRQHLTGGGGMM
jgi:hypothetical protein